MQRIKLSEGIHFNMLERKKFKTNFFQVNFVMNLERENTTKLSLLTGILFKGSEKYPDVCAINNRLDYLYDTNASLYTYKKGERLVLCYESDFLKNEYVPKDSEDLLAEAVEMFRQLVLNPRLVSGGFDEKFLAVEKSQLEKEIKSEINNKSAYARKKCVENMCMGERYSINTDGYIEDISGVDGKNLYEFYLKVLKEAQIEVFFYGDESIGKAQRLFEEAFKDIPKREPKELCETFVTGKAKETLLEITEPMPVNQGNLAIGFRTGVTLNDVDSEAMTLFCEIFGGSPVSKLFMNVREKMSLCYYCRSITDAFKGIMLVVSGIQSENRDKSFEAIMKELSDIKQGKVSLEEFEAAKLSVLSRYKTLDDEPAATCTWYLSRIINGSFVTPLEVSERISKTTLEDVVKAANKTAIDTVYFIKGTNEEAAEVE